MKKTILYITLILGLVYLGACSLNDYPTFDDKDAFAAFESARINVRENAGTLKVPVRVSSLKGVNTTVSLEVKDGTAVSGRDFKVSGGATILSYDGSEPLQYLEIEIIEHEGDFTGDLQFTIEITDAGQVNVGGSNSILINIQDLDHPLAAILGDYDARGMDAWDHDEYTWSGVSFEKDESDVTKVWIRGIFSGYAVSIDVYGIVNEDMTQIDVPTNQETGKSGGYDTKVGGAIHEPWSMMQDGDKITFMINGDVISIKENQQSGVLAYNPDTGALAGWFERAYEIKFTKK